VKNKNDFEMRKKRKRKEKASKCLINSLNAEN